MHNNYLNKHNNKQNKHNNERYKHNNKQNKHNNELNKHINELNKHINELNKHIIDETAKQKLLVFFRQNEVQTILKCIISKNQKQRISCIRNVHGWHWNLKHNIYSKSFSRHDCLKQKYLLATYIIIVPSTVIAQL